jgi:glycosyltransferase involved in cell wall biosynthesis
VLQGVDRSLFHPAPRSGAIPDRFVVFSGGKLEFRKGQDVVLAAFRAFHQRHREALLLTAWSSPWSELTADAAGHPGIIAPTVGPDGIPDVLGWAAANGIPADAVIALGPVPNIAMPHVIREADVALFPNRCEGGTNLVAMECMACGIPTILSANTGHLDLLNLGDVALRLDRQGGVCRSGTDTTDWGESDVEEMVERLEFVWRDRTAAAALGGRAARAMEKLSWRTQIALLLRAIEPVLP